VPVEPMREADIVDELAQHVADDYADLWVGWVVKGLLMRRPAHGD
jgi:hypothetical protein